MKGLCLSMIISHFDSKLISVYMLGGGGGVAIRMFWYAFSEKKKKKKNGCRQIYSGLQSACIIEPLPQ